MEIIGTDNAGNVYAMERGLVSSTVYKAKSAGVHLGDLDDLGAVDWEAIFSGINSNPLIQGLGARIAGRNQQPTVSVNPYQAVSASGPGFFGSMNPMYLMLGAGALVLVMAMRR